MPACPRCLMCAPLGKVCLGLVDLAAGFLDLFALDPLVEAGIGGCEALLVVLPHVLFFGFASGAGDRFRRRQCVAVRLAGRLDVFDTVGLWMGEYGIVFFGH